MRLSRWMTIGVAALVLAGMALAALQGASALAQGGTTGPGPIVYASNRSGNYEIFSLDPETGLATQLTNNPANDVEPFWSSDGLQIAFASDRDGDYELYVMDQNGASLRQLTNNVSEDRQPRWQPGDEFIVYASNVNGQWDLYAITVETGLVRQLTNDPADERGPGAAAAGPTAPTGPVATLTPIPTQVLVPDAVVTSASLNVRENPGTGARILVTIPRDTQVRVLGRYFDNSWLQIQTPTGVVGWSSASLLSVNIDLTRVPVVNATFIYPTATPIPATPIPPTAASAANLVAGIVALDPSTPTCAQTFTVGFDVANLGTQPTGASGTVSLMDTRAADGSSQGTTTGGFPVLAPGQTFRVNMPLTISTWYNEVHNLTLVIDPGNQIPENVEGDNTRTIQYTLQKGACP